MTHGIKSKKVQVCLSLVGLSLFSSTLLAAQAINLQDQPLSVLAAFSTSGKVSKAQVNVKEISRAIDFNQTAHIRMQQYVGEYPVWGADFIVHAPNEDSKNVMQSSHATMNGTIYQGLATDLQNVPNDIFTHEQEERAMNHVMKLYQHPEKTMSHQEARLIVYLDKHERAHWAYLVRLTAQSGTKIPEKPSYIIDAIDFTLYQAWNAAPSLDDISAGGEGGNGRTGIKLYDGLAEHYPTLNMKRDPLLKVCYARNDKMVLRDLRHNLDEVQFSCPTPSRQHNNLYWNERNDYAGGGYSPSNDTLYGAEATLNMYQNWYGIPAWQDKNGKAKRLIFWMHSEDANAAFHPDGYIVIGDSMHNDFYPFTTVDIIAHEISHGLTYQQANLAYYGQSGGLNESFSDMASKAVEYYINGTNKHWMIGEITVDYTKWLRYMDQPSKDCEEGKTPGDKCSIDHMSQYQDSLDVHYSSGIFNRAFYLLATSAGWDTKKAFDVMLKANRHYWTNLSSFCQAARGVVLATKDYGYDTETVLNVFSQVGIDAAQCK